MNLYLVSSQHSNKALVEVEDDGFTQNKNR